MTPTSHRYCSGMTALQMTFAGTAAIAILALIPAPRPDSTKMVRLTDLAVPAATSPQFAPSPPEAPVNLGVIGGFATDHANDQAQQQEQLALQEMQQAEQQAEEQNEQAEEQFEQGMQQAQIDEQQANNP